MSDKDARIIHAKAWVDMAAEAYESAEKLRADNPGAISGVEWYAVRKELIDAQLNLNLLECSRTSTH